MCGASHDNFFIILGGNSDRLAEQLRETGSIVEVLDRRGTLDWPCTRRLHGLLERKRADLIHAHHSRAFVYGLLARLFDTSRPPVLLTEHGRPFPDRPSARQIVATRMLLEQRDRIVAASESIRRALILNDGLPSERVEVIHSGIVPETLIESSAYRQVVRQEIGVPSDAFVVLQIAPFDPSQNHALGIRALAQVARERSGVRLVLAGEGPEEKTIRELVHREGLCSHVRFLDGGADQARLLAAADCLLSTGLANDIPTILVQALIAGCPIVATRAGGVEEIVEDRFSGLLACSGDYGTLADHVLRLHDDPDLRERLGRRGSQRARGIFSSARTWRAYSRLYSSMLSD